MKKKSKAIRHIKTKPTPVAAAAAKPAKRSRFTPNEREKILAAAKARGMTAKQVHKEFGVIPVTFYLWRRKAGLSGQGRMARVAQHAGTGVSNLPAGTRQQVRARVRAQLDMLIREEVEVYLREVLGPNRR